MPCIDTIKIFRYVNKNKKPYYLAYYEDSFHIVEMNYKKVNYLCTPKITNSGKPYIEYTGTFIIDENNHIII